MRTKLASLICLFVLLAGPASVHAQVAPENASDAVVEEVAPAADANEQNLPQLTPAPLDVATERQFGVWSGVFDRIRAQLERQELSLAALGALRDLLSRTVEEVQTYVDASSAELSQERSLLADAAPSEGELVETPQIREQRQKIIDLEAQLQPAELILARGTALAEQIVIRRSEEFASRLFENSTSVLSPSLWEEGLSGLPRLYGSVSSLAVNSVLSVRDRATPAAFSGLIVLIGLLIAMAAPMRRYALRRAQRKIEATPNDLEKMLGAIRVILLSAGIPALGFALVLFTLHSIGGLSLRARTIIEAVSVNVTLYFLVAGFVRALLAPRLPNWRMVPVADPQAMRASRLIRGVAMFYGLGEVVRVTSSAFITPLPVIQVLEAIPTAVAAITIFIAARSLFLGQQNWTSQGDGASSSRLSWRWTVPVASLVALLVLLAQLFGYLSLASFLIDRLVWTSIILASLHLALLLVETVSDAAFQEQGPTSSWFSRNFGVSPSGLGQFGVLLAGALKLFLLLVGSSFIIAPFGVETGAFQEILSDVFTGIEVGGFSFSLTSVLIAIALVIVGLLLTKSVQGWLENRYLPRTNIDAGLKASIRTAIGYVGVIAAVAIGLSSLGLNLENIALVAGALSVGIGFGLQSIVSNFVSGLILLAERPFKPGDWIVVGEEQGIVKRINVRGTEIQTFDRATVLVPNSDFISGTVKNRVHRDTLGRIDIPVGVGYDSDPQKVKEILLEVAGAHPTTLSYPEPAAFFVEFGASSLDFMLFAYLADVGNGYGVRSDIRFEIFRRFKEEGIEIPFAQSDVTIRNLDQVAELLAKAGVIQAEKNGELESSVPTKAEGVRAVPSPTPASDPRPDMRLDMDGDGELDSATEAAR
ncbi:MAG: DUF3772 domain-containing protein [Pseudomonadota bacterium]